MTEQWLCVIEWFDDEMPVVRKIFGLFPSREEAARFGENYLGTEPEELLGYTIQWTTQQLTPVPLLERRW